VEARLKALSELQYERVGLNLRAEMVALKSESDDPTRFEALVNKV